MRGAIERPHGEIPFPLSHVPHYSRVFILRSPDGGRSWERPVRSEEHTSELQSLRHLVCRLLLVKKKSKSQFYSIRPAGTHHLLEYRYVRVERVSVGSPVGCLLYSLC